MASAPTDVTLVATGPGGDVTITIERQTIEAALEGDVLAAAKVVKLVGWVWKHPHMRGK